MRIKQFYCLRNDNKGMYPKDTTNSLTTKYLT